jgi:hypothetical protein
MQLLLSISWWFIFLSIALALFYAWLLYQPNLKSYKQKLMFGLRFLSIFFLTFLLLGPTLLHQKSVVDKPKVLLLMDESESMLGHPFAKDLQQEVLPKWQDIQNELGEDYEVEYFSIGSEVRYSDSSVFKDKRSNLSQLFDYINQTYYRQNIGAVVLASDGIYNRGSNPVFKKFKSQTVLYTLGIGDSTVKKDILIKEVNANAIAYLNNIFPVDIAVAANGFQNQSSTLTISSDGKTLFSQNINFTQAEDYKNISFNIEADKPGTKHLIIQLSPLNGESSLKNNRKDVFIDVIDGREKVLIVYNSPHPDIGAIKEAILTNQNYEVVDLPIQNIQLNELSKYNVVVLHQIPNRLIGSQALINQLKTNRTSVFSILGSQSAVEQVSQLNPLGKIDRHQGRFNESQPILNGGFNFFVLEDNTKAIFNNLPPLKSPYGFYAKHDESNILAFQKIGSVATQTPLWALYNINGEKSSILYGEGFWRWRLYDYAENENFNATNELISKTIQFLSVKDDKRKFKVYPSQNIYDEDEAVKFFGEIYNENYELVNEKDIDLTLINSENKKYNYTLGKNGKSYVSNLGSLTAGAYQFIAKTDDEKKPIKGKFIVNPLQLEFLNTTANFSLLRQLSAQNNGKFYKQNQLDQLIKDLKANTEITGISRTEKSMKELIHLKWIFFIIVLLLSAEWFYRKYEGAY